MTHDRFVEILRECGIPEDKIESIWRTRPSDNLSEAKLRYAAARTLEMMKETRH